MKVLHSPRLFIIALLFCFGHYLVAQTSGTSFDTIGNTIHNKKPLDGIISLGDSGFVVPVQSKMVMMDPEHLLFKFNRQGGRDRIVSVGNFVGSNNQLHTISKVEPHNLQITASGYIAYGQRAEWETHTIKLNGNLDSLASDTPRYNIQALDFSAGFTAWKDGMSLYSDFDTKLYTWPRDSLLAPFDTISSNILGSTTLDDSAHLYLHYPGSSHSYLQTIHLSSRTIQDFRVLAPAIRKVHTTGKGFITVERDTTLPRPTNLVLKKRDTAFQVSKQVALQSLLPGKETLLKKGPRQCFTAIDHRDGSFYVVYGTYRPNGPKYRGNWAYDLGVLKLDAQFNLVYQKDLPPRPKYYLPQDLVATPDGGVLLSLGTFAERNTDRLRLVKINASGQIGLDENPLKNTQPISVYPTRFQSQLTIRGLAAFRYRLSDLQGRKLEEGLVRKTTGEKVHQLKLPQQLPVGSYLLRLETLDGQRSHLQRILKETP